MTAGHNHVVTIEPAVTDVAGFLFNGQQMMSATGIQLAVGEQSPRSPDDTAGRRSPAVGLFVQQPALRGRYDIVVLLNRRGRIGEAYR